MKKLLSLLIITTLIVSSICTNAIADGVSITDLTPSDGLSFEISPESDFILSANVDGAYLEYFENGLSTKIKLTKENFMIGKLRGQCDFTLSNNKISKMHAEFITRGTDYFVKDYNSTNGTYINGSNQRIASNAEYQIFNGDRITLANVDMTFRC